MVLKAASEIWTALGNWFPSRGVTYFTAPAPPPTKEMMESLREHMVDPPLLAGDERVIPLTSKDVVGPNLTATEVRQRVQEAQESAAKNWRPGAIIWEKSEMSEAIIGLQRETIMAEIKEVALDALTREQKRFEDHMDRISDTQTIFNARRIIDVLEGVKWKIKEIK